MSPYQSNREEAEDLHGVQDDVLTVFDRESESP